jgi:hypothetical protein
MKTKLTILAFLLLSLVGAGTAFAQGTAALMTDRELSKFIADWPATVQWCEAKSKQYEDNAKMSLPSALLVDKEFQAFLAKRGWKLERFSYVSGTVFGLMYVATFERKSPEVIKQIDDGIAEIEASELSRADKDQMIKSMNETKRAMLALPGDKTINEAELKLVRARYAEIAKAAGIDTN